MSLIRSDHKPEMILVRSAAEKPPGIPIDAGTVHPPALPGEALFHRLPAGLGQSLEGLVQAALKLLLVRLKPGALVVEAKFPEKLAGLF